MPEKHDCDTCEHKNDSSTEYCGCCDNLTDNYREAGWHIEERLTKQIADQQAEIERLKNPVKLKIKPSVFTQLLNEIEHQRTLIEKLINFIKCEIDHAEAFLPLDDEAQKLNSEGFILRGQAAIAAAKKDNNL